MTRTQRAPTPARHRSQLGHDVHRGEVQDRLAVALATDVVPEVGKLPAAPLAEERRQLVHPLHPAGQAGKRGPRGKMERICFRGESGDIFWVCFFR